MMGPNSTQNDVCKNGQVINMIIHVCTCDNGDARTDGCTEDGANQCSSCNRGFQLNNYVCDACASGQFQSEDLFTGTCQAYAPCEAGFSYTTGTTSTNRVCEICQQGKYQPVVVNENTECIPWLDPSACALGERYVEGDVTTNAQCLTNICVCTNGTEVTGAQCTQHGQLKCDTCDIGFKIVEDNSCEAKYPIECTPDRITDKALARTSYPMATSSQLSFASDTPVSSAYEGITICIYRHSLVSR